MLRVLALLALIGGLLVVAAAAATRTPRRPAAIRRSRGGERRGGIDPGAGAGGDRHDPRAARRCRRAVPVRRARGRGGRGGRHLPRALREGRGPARRREPRPDGGDRGEALDRPPHGDGGRRRPGGDRRARRGDQVGARAGGGGARARCGGSRFPRHSSRCSRSSPGTGDGERAPADEQFADVRAKVAQASVLVDQAVAAAAAGDRERGLRPRADRLPRSLRARRGAAAAAQPEPRARPRVQVRRSCGTASATASRCARCAPTRVAVQQGLRDVDRSLADKGLAAPLDRVRLLVHDPLPRRARGGAADRDPARLARRRARATNYRRPLVLGIAAAVAAPRSRPGCSRRS